MTPTTTSGSSRASALPLADAKGGREPEQPAPRFIAFLPAGVSAEEVTATAYDSARNAVGTAIWPDLDDLAGAP